MTLEQENELKFLEILNNQKEYISRPELGKLIRPIIGAGEYEKIFSGFLNSKNYIIEFDQDENTKHDYGQNKIYSIKTEGRNYLEFLKDTKEKELISFRKSKIDLKNAERMSKTYWWTFWFAVIGLLVSLYLLYLKITGKPTQ